MQEHNVQETQERQEPEEVQVPVPKVGFLSLGCAKNQVNCEQMIWKTYEAGYEVALGAEGCDVAVVNTCGFLKEARDEAMGEIDKLVRQKQAGNLKKIIVTGCMAQWWHNQLAERCPEADGFVGVGSYQDIAKVIDEALEGQRPALFGDINAPVPETDRVVCTSYHWAWLRIAEGCDNRCAYCVIPFIRGKFRSRPEEAILQEAQDLVDAGMKELIVVAQDITRYGLDLYGQRTLAQLLPKLCAIEGVHWVRLHYLYPDEISDELIDVIANEPKIVKYLDIPIQHCNSKILKLMNRRGDGEFLKALFARLRAGIPGLVIRTSLITGLPGEGEEEFAELCDFLREERLERVGAFAFSPEEGTPAAKMEHVDTDTAVKRAEIVEMLQSEIMDAYNAEKLGKTMEVLVDGYDEESGQFYGRTFADSPDIDGRVWIASDEPVHEGDFVMVKIDGCTDGDLCGYVVEEEA